ncbi:MAG: plasmid stability protein [Kiritimatiellia bacterium]|jgi:plasmid stability protein
MKNVTITLEEEVARWARIRAAENDTSVSRMVGELLKQQMQSERIYEQAHQDYASRKVYEMRTAGQAYPKRDELYER